MPRIPVNSPYTITTQFGVPDSNALFGSHSGIDYAVPLNRQVYAPTTGTVTFAGWSPSGGNMVQIFDGKYYHRLMHNNSLQVKVGDKVNEGQSVALAGTTGLSTGVHCHWDVATQVNPTSFAAFIDPNSIMDTGDDMYEGRTAKDWATQAKDAEQYKQQVVKSLSWKKIDGQIGGGMEENPGNIRSVIDSLEVFKADTLANPGSPIEPIVIINGERYVPKETK